MPVSKTWLLRLAILIAAAGLLYGVLSGHSRFTNNRGGTDFNTYYLAGQTILDGNALELYSVRSERGFLYLYLPLFAILMAPLSFFPIAVASIIWNALSLLMIGHSALMLYRGHLPGPPGGHALRVPFVAYLLCVSVASLSENLLLGQVHVLLMYLMVLAWTYDRKKMEWVAGFFVGAAVVLKLLPAVFGLYFLLTRQRRALSSMLLTTLLLVGVVPALVIGFETNARLVNEFYGAQIKPFVSGETSDAGMYTWTAIRKTLGDQDLGALLTRHLAKDHGLVEQIRAERYQFLNLLSLDTSQVRRLMFPIFAALLVVTTVAFSRRRKLIDSDTAARDLFFSLFVLLSLLLSPRMRLPYLTVLVIPYALLIKNLLTEHDERTVYLSRLALALSVGSVVLYSLPLFRALTVLFYGLIFLFVGLLVLLEARGRPASAGAANYFLSRS